MVRLGSSSAEQPKDLLTKPEVLQQALAPDRARAMQGPLIQRMGFMAGKMIADSTNADIRRNLFEKNISLYWQQAPAYYEAAKPELMILSEQIRRDMTEANPAVPEVLREQVSEILQGLIHPTPKNDEVPDGAPFLSKEGKDEFRVNMRAIDRHRNALEDWLANPVTQSNPKLRAVIQNTLNALNLYASKVDIVGKNLFDARQMGPEQKDLYRRENQVGRLAVIIIGGGLGLMTGAMALFSKNKDFRMPAIYLGLATIAAMGGKRLREYPSEKLLSEITFIGQPGGDYERVTVEHQIRGPEWRKIAKSMKELDLTEQVMIDLKERGLTDAQAETLAARLTKDGSPERGKLKNMILNKRADFLSFLGLVQKSRSDEAQTLLYDYLDSGASPAALQIYSEQIQQQNAAAGRPS